MKDFLGKLMKEGDQVVTTSNSHNELIIGEILSVSAHMAYIKPDDGGRTFKRFHKQIIVTEPRTHEQT